MAKKPSDFYRIFPGNSCFENNEDETVAQNIMVILARTGNDWRKLSWQEYRMIRLKDGHFSEIELGHFERVVEYCASEEAARSFSRWWKAV